MEARHLYYEASALIIGLINLRTHAGSARVSVLKALEKLLVSPAHRTRRDRTAKKRPAGGRSADAARGSPAIACRWMAKYRAKRGDKPC